MSYERERSSQYMPRNSVNFSIRDVTPVLKSSGGIPLGLADLPQCSSDIASTTSSFVGKSSSFRQRRRVTISLIAAVSTDEDLLSSCSKCSHSK